MSIAILCPTRGRPARFWEMVDAATSTATGHVAIYAAIDTDDPSPYLLPRLDRDDGIEVKCVFRVRHDPGEKLNGLAKAALRDGHTILASFGDDHRPRTPGWDVAVTNAMNALGAGLVYGADGLQDERLPTAPFWHASIIRALGWYSPPPLRHLYQDDYWLRLANDLGRRSYLPDVLIEHLHPSAGKATMDEQNRTIDSFYDHDREALAVFLRDQHPEILARMEAACSTPQCSSTSATVSETSGASSLG
jgi:hypothetical protein